MKKKYADIVLPVPIDQSFTYLIPPELNSVIQPGMRVLVPFGKRKLTGYVVDLPETTSIKKLRTIEDILDEEPALSAEILQLARWISEYYLCPLGEVLKATLPAGIDIELERIIRINPSLFDIEEIFNPRTETLQSRVVEAVKSAGKLNFKQLAKKVGSTKLHYTVLQLVKNGLLTLSEKLPDAKVKPQIVKFVRLKKEIRTEDQFYQLLEKLKPGAKKQLACLKFLWERQTAIPQTELIRQCKASSQTVARLIESNMVSIEKREVIRHYYDFEIDGPAPEMNLNSDQTQALATISQIIEAEQYRAFLLHGVTGSGKTQIYIEALKKALARGKGGIVLVPEISLTPQTVRRFQSNFPNQVAVQHSRMSPGERYDSWRKVKQGTYRIVVGARSAIFAPVENLGLIIVDEEHEASYKQFETNPLYHARDVAVMRARSNQAVVILGSATPSVESYYNGLNQKYHLIQLPRRIDDIPMPEVRIIDMAREHRVYGFENTRVFSHLLKKKIKEKLERQEQIILLQNRRGYSPYIRCKKCGHIEQCFQCNITLTYHKKISRLRCHYCGYTTPVITECPECGDEQIIFKGVGTQKVEEELTRLFPEARVVRMDLDTTQGKLAHDKIITSFGEGKYDILLGTQMVAKGLDFHRVTLVGVISADTGLFLPDFRAAERTFQLLTQVAGRAGRKGAQGEVIIQTYSPNHTCLFFARKHDFVGFYQQEDQARQELNYPPYGRIISLLFKGEAELEVARAANTFKALLQPENSPFDVLGPAPAPLTKVLNQYRWQIVVKSPRKTDPAGTGIRRFIQKAVEKYQQQMKDCPVRISIDVDPMALC